MRKYDISAKGQFVEQLNVKTNSELLADTAKETKALAITSAAIAEKTREAIEQSKELLKLAFSGQVQQSSNVNDETISVVKEQFAKEVIRSLDTDGMSYTDVDLVNQTVLAAVKSPKAFERRPLPGVIANGAVPDLSSVEVNFAMKGKGTVDGFTTKLTFSVKKEVVTNVKAFRIFRADIEQSGLARGQLPLSTIGVTRISNFVGRKNNEQLQMVEKRLIENGTKNDYTEKLPTDGITQMRYAYSQQKSVTFENAQFSGIDTGKRKLEAALSPFIDPTKFQGMDLGVANNLNVLRNIINQNPSVKVTVLDRNRAIGIVENDPQAGVRLNDNNLLITEKNNASSFKEIGFFSIEKLRSKEVADTIQLTLEDVTVMYGRSYMYYVVSVDQNMNESVRSKIVNVTIERLIPPKPPIVTVDTSSDRFISLVCCSDDELVEKFEIYRRDDSNIDEELDIIRVGSSLNRTVTKKTNNGFIQIGESLSTKDSAVPFRDKRAVPGKTYTYRIYSVDIFGNKCQTPVDVQAFLKDRSDKITNLKKPTILAELDRKTGFINVTLTNDDDRVIALFLSRRDLSLKERTFRDPMSPAVQQLGMKDATRANSSVDNILFDKRATWNGYISVPEKGKDIVVQTDRLTRFDHTYQYSVHGVDRFGNKSSVSVSKPIFVSRDPRIEAPINVKAQLQFSSSSRTPTGVVVSWDEGNLDVEPTELLGNREVLDNYKIRTLYQVERKRLGDEFWEQFPLIEERSLTDKISDESAPTYRPVFLKPGETYQYRIAAFQTGSFISDFSQPVTIKTDQGVLPPTTITIRASDVSIKPFYVAVNWEIDPRSGVVDVWEIERAVVNNIYGSRLDSKNVSELEKLDFKLVSTVGNESTRARSKELDDALGRSRNSVFVADRYYIDSDVQLGNTYYYRVRAVSSDKTKSAWLYKGVVLTDTSFDNMISKILRIPDKTTLSVTPAPLAIRKR